MASTDEGAPATRTPVPDGGPACSIPDSMLTSSACTPQFHAGDDTVNRVVSHIKAAQEFCESTAGELQLQLQHQLQHQHHHLSPPLPLSSLPRQMVMVKSDQELEQKKDGNLLYVDNSKSRALFAAALDQDIIDLETLRSLAQTRELPTRYRALVWQLLMHYLPPQRDKWATHHLEKRLEYQRLVEELWVPAHQRVKALGPRATNCVGDHPDIALYCQIDTDVARTYPIGFENLFSGCTLRCMLRRTLFVWSRLHAATGYFQGLNEIPTMFMLVFLHHVTDGHLERVPELLPTTLVTIEAEAYYCMTLLLDQLQRFNKEGASLMHAEAMVCHLESLLAVLDEPLLEHLCGLGVGLMHFAFRWFACIMLRDMDMRYAALLWDHLIAHEEGFSVVLMFVCAAFLLEHSQKLRAMSLEQVMDFMHRKMPEDLNNPKQIKKLVAEARKLLAASVMEK
eukprot:TRINITY_DN8540_c0_g1_i2.p1 TRINITY_DN8540_c0_g1~~TRINITY_DN8540_c0_g1_i2.p1  ORF type:complete len:460 (-),score=106.95 TRINITY_DN8540_c0_g1_i2:25-1383(-)